LRVLIVPDKFKGTLTAAEACAAIAAGWQSARGADGLDRLPMSDGGEGFGAVMGQLLQACQQTVRTVDAAHRPLRAHWWYEPGRKLALIEAARVIGLDRLPPKKFHPFQLDTFGLGRLIEDAAKAGARQCFLGIGGSATNDAGFGLARALGWQFHDKHGLPLEEWWQLTRLHRFQRPSPARPWDMAITVAADVTNPLLGPKGCTRIYGLQKGIRPQDIAHAEKCLRRLKRVLEQQLGIALATAPGAGAAGGLGFGLMAFTQAEIRPGFETFAQAAKLTTRIRRSDLVITGEGSLDRQTGMGKGVGQVARLCRQFRVPCLALAGVVIDPDHTARLFTQSHALTELASLADAQKRAKHHLQHLSALAARVLFIQSNPSSFVDG
jgi:glycerate kinase